MIRNIIAIMLLIWMPVPGMVLLRMIDKRISFAAGYVGAVVCNLGVFHGCVTSMAESMEAPGTMPVKMVLALCALELVLVVVLCVIFCVRAGKWLGMGTLLGIPYDKVKRIKDKERRASLFMLFAAILLWLWGASYYLRYVPEDALTMMADINRMDFFGVTNRDSMVMLGYYMKKLLSLSQADAVCMVIPLGMYPAFVAVMWEMAGALTKEKRSFCFLAEAILVLLGDCFYSVPYLVLHGLTKIENQMLLLVLPLVFSVGLHLYFSEEKLWDGENKKITGVGYGILLLICIFATKIVDVKVYALVCSSIVIFGVLFAGRRYLPWLKSSES